MVESKDPGIKLFGRQIPLSSSEASADDLPSSSEIDYAEKPGEQDEDDDGEATEKVGVKSQGRLRLFICIRFWVMPIS